MTKSQAAFHRKGSRPRRREAWLSPACNNSCVRTNRHSASFNPAVGLIQIVRLPTSMAATRMSCNRAVGVDSTSLTLRRGKTPFSSCRTTPRAKPAALGRNRRRSAGQTTSPRPGSESRCRGVAGCPGSRRCRFPGRNVRPPAGRRFPTGPGVRATGPGRIPGRHKPAPAPAPIRAVAPGAWDEPRAGVSRPKASASNISSPTDSPKECNASDSMCQERGVENGSSCLGGSFHR